MEQSNNGFFERIRGLKSRNKMTVVGSVLLAAGIAAAVAAKVFSTIKPQEETPASLVEGGRGQRSPQSLQFDISSYSPPTEGIITDRHLGSQRETIIYIPDTHPKKHLPADLNAKSLAVQKEVYLIIKDLIKKYGRITIVQEGVQEGWDMSKLERTVQALNNEEFEREKERAPIIRLLRERSLGKRRGMADEIIGSAIIQASAVIKAAFPDQITIVGTTTPGSITHPKRGTELLSEVTDIMSRKERFLCDSEEKGLTLADAAQKFNEGDRAGPVTDCYCRYRDILRKLWDEYMQIRSIYAPKMEIGIALDHADKEITVVVAGHLHLHESLKLLRQTDTSYVVVCPRSTKQECEDAAKNPPPAVEGFPDDNIGTCEKRRAMK